MNKYRMEKMLHEIIRDLPEAAKVDRCLDRGYITIEDALTIVSRIIRAEKEAARQRKMEPEKETTAEREEPRT